MSTETIAFVYDELPKAPKPKPLKRVSFRHPGYSDEKNTFLFIYVYDLVNGNPDVGIEYELAETCCSIVAGNRFGDGFLTQQKLRSNGPITEATRQEHKVNQNILYHTEYYFYLIGYAGDSTMGAAAAYPVFPNFQNYVFPHGKLPDNFKQAKFLPQTRNPNINQQDEGASAA